MLLKLRLELYSFRLSEFGHSVYKYLSKEKQSWNAYNLAALYWRMKGEPYEAIECARRGFYVGATAESHYVSLVSLGNILHQSLRSEDASIVLGKPLLPSFIEIW